MRYLDLSEDVGYRSRRFDDTISEIGCLLFLNYTYITFFFLSLRVIHLTMFVHFFVYQERWDLHVIRSIMSSGNSSEG